MIRIIYVGNIKVISHDQKLFQNSMEKSFETQRIFIYKIFGLAIGMACSLLIFLFVKDETSYDRFHHDSGQIYRVVKDFINDDGSRIPDATTPPALAPAMQKEIPEVAVTTVFPGWGANCLVKYGDKKINEDKLYRVDSSFFDVFTFPLFMEIQKML